jgi:hypothetical protein
MPLETLTTASTRYKSKHRVISGFVVCKGCHQPTNTNAISKQKRKGSAFGGCSCGKPKTHGIPCVHMVAVVKSCHIEGLYPVNAMPPSWWWMTAHWLKQYPQRADLICNLDIQMLKNALQDTTWRYCPPNTALNKAGYPKKNKRLKLAIEFASEQ